MLVLWSGMKAPSCVSSLCPGGCCLGGPVGLHLEELDPLLEHPAWRVWNHGSIKRVGRSIQVGTTRLWPDGVLLDKRNRYHCLVYSWNCHGWRCCLLCVQAAGQHVVSASWQRIGEAAADDAVCLATGPMSPWWSWSLKAHAALTSCLASLSVWWLPIGWPTTFTMMACMRVSWSALATCTS
jgi:hypothetical protein